MKRVLIALVLFLVSLAPTHAADGVPALRIAHVQAFGSVSATIWLQGLNALPSKPNELQWDLTRIGAPSAWSVGADGHGVRVLVIDTGLDRTVATTALSGSILPSMSVNPLHGQTQIPCAPGNFTGSPCYKATLLPNPNAYIDGIGHGTFVTSEIVGHGASYGFYGVAPKAHVAMAKVFLNADAADTSDIANAIDWGVTNHYAIISMSLGGPGDPVLDASVARAVAAGVLVVAATGNAGAASPGYPAAYPGVIAVGASGQWDYPTSWSNKGPMILAPGDFVWGLAPEHPTLINCGGLCQWEGTSMATPEVAGALADLLSWGLSPKDAEAALLAGARKTRGWNSYLYGAGILDINGAMRWASAPRAPRH